MPQTKFEAQEESCMDSNNKSGQKMLFACRAVVDQFLVKDLIKELEIEIDSVPDGDFENLYGVSESRLDCLALSMNHLLVITRSHSLLIQ